MLVNGTTSGASSLAFVTPSRTRPTPTSLNGGTNPLVAFVQTTDPAKAEALEADLVQGEQAVGKLETAEQEMREARKEAARQKLERLKAELQALRMLANSDPEAAAREAARLARELASAVREYVSAGGDASAAAGASAPGVADTASEEDDEPNMKTLVATQPAPPVAGDDADGQFFREARAIKKALKDIIEAIKREREGDSSARAADLRDADRALRDTERTLGGMMIGTTSTAAPPTVSLLV